MGVKVANNAVSSIAGAISTATTTVAVTAGTGGLFPVLGAGDYFYATLTSAAGAREIVKVTARTDDTMTIVRAQEGTFGQGFPANSRFELRVTAASVTDMVAELSSQTVKLADLADTAPGDGAAMVGFLQAGAGAVARTAQSKMRDVVSVKDFGAVGDGATDDTVAIQAAVTAALAIGDVLYWPDAVYLTTASIANLHSVKHSGSGVVRRGSDYFYPSPIRTNTNILYISPTGNTTNDGLSASQPMTGQTAANALRLYGPTLDGTWRISAAAGTYNRDTILLPTGLLSRNAIEIRGPATGDFRTVPTAIFDGQSQPGTCIAGSFLSRALVKDIKLANWCDVTPSFASGAFAGIGLDFAGETSLTLENVHADRCDAGWNLKSGVTYSIRGGIITNCGVGAHELFGVIRDYKAAASTTNRTTIQSCTFGFKAKELCTGHLDYIEFLDNTYAVHGSRGVTGNLSNCVFLRNGTAVTGIGASSFVDYLVTWGTGADKNTVKLSLDASSAEIGRRDGENARTTPFLGRGGKLCGNRSTTVTHTGTLTDTAVATFNTTAIGDFQEAGEFYEGVAYGTATLASTATIRFRVGGNGASALTMPIGTYGFQLNWRFTSSGGDAQIAFAKLERDNGNSVVGSNTRTYAFSTTSFLLGLFVQLGATGDSVTIFGAHLFSSEM